MSGTDLPADGTPQPAPPTSGVPAHDALILSGGRSSRLGGEPKALLRAGGTTLLARTVEAAAGAGQLAVVGPEEYLRAAGLAPGQCLSVREDPPYSGPAAAIGAGLDALDRAGAGAPWLLVLACDMPGIAAAVDALLKAAGSPGTPPGTSLLACAEGRAQPLAGLHDAAALRAAVREQREAGGLENLSVFKLLARVQRREVPVPAGSTSDVDTWEDARRAGAVAGPGPSNAGAPEPQQRSTYGKPGGAA